MFFEAFLRAPDGANCKIADWSLTASRGSPSLKGCVQQEKWIWWIGWVGGGWLVAWRFLQKIVPLCSLILQGAIFNLAENKLLFLWGTRSVCRLCEVKNVCEVFRCWRGRKSNFLLCLVSCSAVIIRLITDNTPLTTIICRNYLNCWKIWREW